MKIEFMDKKIEEIKSDMEIKIVTSNEDIPKEIEKLGFEAKNDSLVVDKKVIYVGSLEQSEDIKIAICEGVNKFKSTNFKSCKISLSGSSHEQSIKNAADGIVLGKYEYNRYKSKQPKSKNQKIYISALSSSLGKIENFKTASKLFEKYKTINCATNFAKDIVNTPPQDFCPKSFEEKAQEIAKDSSLKLKVIKQKELQKENFNALLAVARASCHEPRVIHLTHKPKNAKKKIVLIGKGLTYDSGGLSLKPSTSMVSMKSDKSGGAAVLAIMKAASELDLGVEVHAIIGAVENMIGGNAYKPDDVLISKSGKTIEVQNTDAEGRLVLADCLTYAQKSIKNFDYILDFATLTGACVVALGEYTSGVMGFDTKLKHNIVKNALNSGELAGTLPFNDYLAKTLKSEIADICNISNSRYGGAITAGLFLSNFIEEKNKNKWVHIDIAGPAFVEKSWGYNQFGASGAGVRMGVSFIESIQ